MRLLTKKKNPDYWWKQYCRIKDMAEFYNNNDDHDKYNTLRSYGWEIIRKYVTGLLYKGLK